MTATKIALIYGRDLGAKRALSAVVTGLGLVPRDFNDAIQDLSPSERPYNPNIVRNLFNGVEAAVVALSHDEDGFIVQGLVSADSDTGPMPRSRPNVYLEYGMALAFLDSKVIEIMFGPSYLDLPSDELGLNPIMWTNATDVANKIAERLTQFGISTAKNEDLLQSIAYVPPNPSFEESEPPYEFIRDPWSLDVMHTVAWPPETKSLYQQLGFEFSTNMYASQRVIAEQEGWQLAIHKDQMSHRYKTMGFQAMPPDTNLKMFWVRRKSSN